VTHEACAFTVSHVGNRFSNAD